MRLRVGRSESSRAFDEGRLDFTVLGWGFVFRPVRVLSSLTEGPEDLETSRGCRILCLRLDRYKDPNYRCLGLRSCVLQAYYVPEYCAHAQAKMFRTICAYAYVHMCTYMCMHRCIYVVINRAKTRTYTQVHKKYMRARLCVP